MKKNLLRSLCVTLVVLMLLPMLPLSIAADDTQVHTDLALEAVQEGIVLLKNDNNALPLAKGAKIALFGEGQIFTGTYESGYRAGGGGSGWVYPREGAINGPFDSFKAAENEGKISLYDDLSNEYSNNLSYVPDDTMYNNAAANADIAVMIITRFSRENSDMAVSDWYLTDTEKAMMKTLDQKFKKLVVILNTPNPMDTSWSLEGSDVTVDALLACYMGGQRGADGIVDIVLGEANPSGKLTDTYAKDIYDYPTTDNFLENDAYVNYTEDIYMGYRYFETFAKDKVAYPFGFGLSYTNFNITTNSVVVRNNKIHVNVTVKNTGSVTGKEVVQVYYSAPQAGEGSAVLSKSAIVLAGYKKTKLLAPNESQTFTISYDIKDMASYDDTGLTGNKACYVLEAGDYKIHVGNSVRTAGESSSVGTYTVGELKVTERLTSRFDTNLTKRMNSTGGYDVLNPEEELSIFDVSDTEPTWIEAENGDIGNKGINVNYMETCAPSKGFTWLNGEWVNTGSATVLGNFNNATVGGEIKYTLNVAKAGTYNLGFLMANGITSGGSEDFLDIYVNGTKVGSLDAEATGDAGTTSKWFNFKFSKTDLASNAYSVELPSGEVTLSFKVTSTATDARVNIDKFAVIPTDNLWLCLDVDAVAANKIFRVTETSLTWIEAEYGAIFSANNFTNIGGNNDGIKRYEKTTDTSGSKPGYIYNGSSWESFAGATVIGNFNAAQHAVDITYKLQVDKAGTYKLGAVMANGYAGTDATDVFDVYVNGEKQSVSLDAPNTRNVETGYEWFNFKFTDTDLDNNDYLLNLPAGEVDLVLKLTDSGKANARPNIDRFVIIPESESCSATEVITYHNGNAQMDLTSDSYQGIIYEDVQSGRATLEQLIDQMSYEELIDLCSGHTSSFPESWSGTGTIGFSSIETQEKYGIYAADTADGPAGIRLKDDSVEATFWPCATLQACTWNVELLERIGKAVGEEALLYDVDIWLAPGLNLHRNPLCGRNFEYYSEDPLVSGKCASAVVNGAESKGIACTIKHLAANAKETNRKKSDSRVSEKALRELYLKGFEIAIKESDPMCLMTSYNLINGIHTSANVDLIRGVLRDEWGYEGLVMSDWNTTPLITNEVLAGNNVTMPQGEPDELAEAVRRELLSREDLEQNAYNIITTLANLPEHAILADYDTADNGELLYKVDFSGNDGEYVSSQISNMGTLLNAATYTYNPYTGDTDSSIIIDSSNSVGHNHFAGDLASFNITNHTYTLSYWAEKESETSNAFDIGMYFAHDGTYRGFGDGDGEENIQALFWKYNSSTECFYPVVDKTTSLADEGKFAFEGAGQSGKDIPNQTNKKYGTQYLSFLPSTVKRAVDVNNGNRQYYKVVIDGTVTPPTMDVYALSVNGRYELCGTKKLTGTLVDNIRLGMYCSDKILGDDYLAMGGVKIFKGNTASVTLSSEEKVFLAAANGERTFENGDIKSPESLIYTVDFRQAASNSYGSHLYNSDADGENRYGTVKNSAGYLWGIAAAEQATGTNAMSEEFISSLNSPYQARNVSSVYKDGYGVELSKSNSTTTMRLASYMPYVNNWQFGNYTLELFLDSNVAVNIAVLETNGWMTGVRIGDSSDYPFLYSGSFAHLTAEQANQASESVFTRGENEEDKIEISYNQAFKFYDHITNPEKYTKVSSVNLLVKPSDESANVKVEFDNDKNIITYYALINTSTDANVVTPEWVAVAAIEYFEHGYENNRDDIYFKPLFGITAQALENGTATVKIRNVNIYGNNFNTAADGEILQKVDFEGADTLGYDTTTGKANTSGNSSGYLWNTLDWTDAAQLERVEIPDRYTLHAKPYGDAQNNYVLRAFASSRLNKEWRNTNFTVELAVNSTKPVALGLLHAGDEDRQPFGFTLSGNVGNKNYTNARFSFGGNYIYENMQNSGGTSAASHFEDSGISLKSYYYSGGVDGVADSNLYPTRVDTSLTGETNVKVEFNNTLKQMTLYELCYNNGDTGDTSWKKIASVDYSKATQKNLDYLEALFYFWVHDWDNDAYFSNVQIVHGLTAILNEIDDFDQLKSGDTVYSTTLEDGFAAENANNSFGTKLPFDISSIGSFTVGMLLDSNESQRLSLLKSEGSNYAYSTIGFTFDANNEKSLSSSFTVENRMISASNTDVENILRLKLDSYESSAARYYADGITENIRIEFNSVEGTITLYELVDADNGEDVTLRYVRVAEISGLDSSDYDLILEGTAEFSNVNFLKGFHAIDVGIRAKQISERYAADGVENSSVDVRYVATVTTENFYYAGISAYLVQNDGNETMTSNTVVRTINSVGRLTAENNKFSPLDVEGLNSGDLLYTVTIKNIPAELEWVEIHATPFVINQKFDNDGDFVYSDDTDVNELIKRWDYGKGEADIGTLGIEKVIFIDNTNT